MGWPQVYKQDLVFRVMDDGADFRFQSGFLGRAQVALKNGVLQVVSKVLAGFERQTQTLVIRHVITDQVGVSHGVL